MKLGEIRKYIGSLTSEAKYSKEGAWECLQTTIKDLPTEVLEDWFKDRYNKNLDYDQWVGIRDVLRGMGHTLWLKNVTILGDAIFAITHDDQAKITALENEVAELTETLEATLEKLQQYED